MNPLDHKKYNSLYCVCVHHTQVSSVIFYPNAHYLIDITRKSADAGLMQLTVVIGQYVNNIRGKEVMQCQNELQQDFRNHF